MKLERRLGRNQTKQEKKNERRLGKSPNNRNKKFEISPDSQGSKKLESRVAA
jgi:hypothetical protein